MDNKRELFEKQRRNLIVISVTVFLINYLGLNFNQISILGNQATITNPSNITNILWVLMAYWFARYSQYFYVIETTFTQDLSSRRDEKLTEIAKKLHPYEETPGHKHRDTSAHVFESSLFSVKVRMYHESTNEGVFSDFTAKEVSHCFTIRDIYFVFITLQSIISIYIKTPYFTEYLLPYLLCLGVVTTSVASIT